jgi:hypothetical protein
MNRKDKINLINQLELGDIPIEMFQKPKVILKKVQIIEFRSSKRVFHDEDASLSYLKSSKSGINPFTGNFYGVINVNIVK